VPQLRLDYTANIIEKNNFAALFEKCHKILADTLAVELYSCKSRAMQQEHYYIGNGDPNNAFVCLQLQVMSGRSREVLSLAVQMILTALKDHFAESLQQQKLQITLELVELSNQMYFKLSS